MTTEVQSLVAARRGRPRSAAAEAAALEAAYRLLAVEGLAATTVDAVARASAVSKMTIYKWWPSREALLIEAFLRQAAAMLPLDEDGDPLVALRRHATAYASALDGDFGRVQRAVVAECISKTGSAQLFADRYLKLRRALVVRLITAARGRGTIGAMESAADLYDRIYGTLFYQSTFALRHLTPAYVRRLVDGVLLPR